MMAAAPPWAAVSFAAPQKVKISQHISASFSSRKRKNHLRMKILKKLGKPLSQQQPLENPVIPAISPEQTAKEDFDSEGISVKSETEENSVTESVSSNVVVDYKGKVGNFSVVKFVLFVIGSYVFQAVCAALMFSDREVGENGGKEGLDLNFGGDKVLGNREGLVLIENFNEKVEEIREMVREVRRVEKEESGYGSDNEDDDEEERGNGVGKEVDARLKRLERRRSTKRAEFSGLYMSYLSKYGRVGDGVDGSELKGFDGSEGRGIYRVKKSSADSMTKMVKNEMADNESMGEVYQEKKVETKGDELSRNSEESNGMMGVVEELNVVTDDENQEKKQEKKVNGQIKNTGDLEISQNTAKAATNGKSVALKSENYSSSRREERAFKSDECSILRSSSGLGEVGENALTQKVENDQLDEKSDLWWLKLPYVLTILMERSSGNERIGGLYTLKMHSKMQDRKAVSYTVAFEDRGDANNFCLLLESYFEDSGDFRADVIPLSRKELHESIESEGMKIIVVKKGQLKLYAGQPLADVEMSLRMLVEKDQIACMPN